MRAGLLEFSLAHCSIRLFKRSGGHKDIPNYSHVWILKDPHNFNEGKRVDMIIGHLERTYSIICYSTNIHLSGLK